MIDATKLPKGEQLWDSMNVIHLKDGREIIGIIEGDDKKVKSEDSITVTNITSRQGTQEVIDRLEASGDENRTRPFQATKYHGSLRETLLFFISTSSISICPSACIVDFAPKSARQSALQ